jgi:hypothetical protein
VEREEGLGGGAGRSNGDRVCVQGRGGLRGRLDTRSGGHSIEGRVHMRVGARQMEAGYVCIRQDVQALATPFY